MYSIVYSIMFSIMYYENPYDFREYYLNPLYPWMICIIFYVLCKSMNGWMDE